MTGTGTQTDPYVVDNWDDFLSVCGVSFTAYVKWADLPESQKTVDFNKIPTQNVPNIRTHVDFNGWTLRNWHGNPLMFDGLYGGITPVIENLNFVNYYIAGSAFILGTGGGTSSNYISSRIFRNCKFSGFHFCPNSGTYGFSQGSGYLRFAYENCSFNVSARSGGGNGNFQMFSHGSLTNCRVKANVKTNQDYAHPILTQTTNNPDFSGCKFELDYKNGNPAQYLVMFSRGTGSYNVFDIESNVSGQIDNQTGISLYRADILPVGITVTGTNLAGYTAADLADPSRLQSLGFPIGV